jgi:hypothetical protein
LWSFVFLVLEKDSTINEKMSSTAALVALDNELSILAVDLQSEKITGRSKAFEKLNDFLDNRSIITAAYDP